MSRFTFRNHSSPPAEARPLPAHMRGGPKAVWVEPRVGEPVDAYGARVRGAVFDHWMKYSVPTDEEQQTFDQAFADLAASPSGSEGWM